MGLLSQKKVLVPGYGGEAGGKGGVRGVELAHVDLFSGIGGFALAARWAGLKTVQFVEIDKFCQKVLAKNFKGVPIHDDIKTFTFSPIENDGRHIGEPEKRSAPEFRGNFEQGTIERRPFLLTGGFPCQPFSCAGKRRGKGDDRYLWPEALRVIAEFQPLWVILENVAGIFSILEPDSISEVEAKEIELFQQDENYKVSEVIERIHRRIIGIIITDLEKIGYDFARSPDGTPILLCLPACAVNAPHRRDRVWIVAHSVLCPDRTRGRSAREEDSLPGINRETLGSGVPTRTIINAINSNGSGCNDSISVSKSVGCGMEATAERADCHAPHAKSQQAQSPESGGLHAESCGTGGDVGNAESGAEQTVRGICERAKPDTGRSDKWSEPWLEVAQRLCGVSHGLPNRLVRYSLTMPVTNGIIGFILMLRRYHYATSKETRTRKVLPILQEAFGEKSVQRCFGKLSEVFREEDLWCPVHGKVDGEREGSEEILRDTGKKVQEGELRGVQYDNQSGHTPQERGLVRQCSCEFDDIVCELSSEIALGEWKRNAEKAENILYRMWEESRGERFLHEPLPALYEIWRSVTDYEIGAFRRHYLKRNEHRVQKLKALGNAIVPQVAYEIMRAILEVENA